MFRTLIILTLLMGYTQTIFAANGELPSSVVAALKKVGVPTDKVSVYVSRVDSASPILQHNANQALNPASVMKLLTTYAGLELLSPAYRWKTELYTDGTLNNGVLDGNLILKGYGDPSLMAPDFWRLIGNLRQIGVRQIKGDLVIDNTYFNPINQDPGAFDGEPYRTYNAIPVATLVNLNSTSFMFQAVDMQAAIRVDPDLPEIKVVNQLKVVNQACGDWKSKMTYDVKPDANGVTITFKGVLGADCNEKYLDLSVFSSQQYTLLLFKKIWSQLGGVFNGKVKLQALPSNAKKLMQQESKPLADIVRDINKYSNNLIARQLFLTLSAEKIGVPATESEAAEAINAWLQNKGLSFTELSVENGSGLSRTDRISAQHLGQLLIAAYNSPVMPELMSSLPILALDGTVEKRLKDSLARGRAHLKTGSINGVFTIAGYELDNKNQRWVVVFMANHPKASMTKPAQDALFEWVYQQSSDDAQFAK